MELAQYPGVLASPITSLVINPAFNNIKVLLTKYPSLTSTPKTLN